MDPTPSGPGWKAQHLGALDDLLAEMGAGIVTESADEVRSRVRALVAAIEFDVHTDYGAVPPALLPPPVFRHGIAPDDRLFDAFGAADLGSLIDDSLDGAIVALILLRDGPGFDAARMARSVLSIKELCLAVPAGGQYAEVDGPHDSIVRDLVRDRPKLAGLGQLVGEKDLDIPLCQVDAVFCFLDAYPLFWPSQIQGRTVVKFNSSTADGRGGGLFDRGVIHLSKLRGTPPGAFVRLLVHEMGHATFEMALLDRRPIPEPLDQNKVPGMLVHFGEPIEQGLLSELSRAGQQSQSCWDGMTFSAKTFYRAWLTLRKDGGRHLLGLDLWQDPRGNRLSCGQRRRYQAGQFSEFCAEVFMLYAMGDLAPHVVALLADRTIDPDVQTAWRNAWRVLDVVASPILGKRVG
jgi:hypothetical protein